MQHVIATASTAQTDTSLIAAPSSGFRIALYGIYISSEVQQQVDVEHGSTLLHRQFVPANGGSVAAFNARPGMGSTILWEAPEATSVTYTTSVAGNFVIEAWYDIVRA